MLGMTSAAASAVLGDSFAGNSDCFFSFSIYGVSLCMCICYLSVFFLFLFLFMFMLFSFLFFSFFLFSFLALDVFPLLHNPCSMYQILYRDRLMI